MKKEKLVITSKKFNDNSTSIISARVPTELMKQIETLAKKTNRNRNEIIQILLNFAIENAEIKNNDEGDE